MAIELEEETIGIPEWVVTFGDMMSLLLTFFIMLVSMSEIKQDELYQALAESMRRRFGHDTSMMSMVPGNIRPRNSILSQVASMGRSKRAHTMKGGAKVRAPVGSNPRVRTIRSGDQVTTGGVIYFEEDVAELTEANKRQLQIAVQQIGGKPQKVEVRGHASRKPISKDSSFRDKWDLINARCRSTVIFLVEQGINRDRIRMSNAGDNEPVYLGVDPKKRKRNSRVEVFMLDERVQDLEGTPEEKEERFSSD